MVNDYLNYLSLLDKTFMHDLYIYIYMHVYALSERFRACASLSLLNQEAVDGNNKPVLFVYICCGLALPSNVHNKYCSTLL